MLEVEIPGWPVHLRPRLKERGNHLARHARPDALSAQAKLTALNLPFMRENCQPLANTAADKHWSHLDYFRRVAQQRGCQREDRRVRQLHPPGPLPRDQDDPAFDWNWPTKINRPQVRTSSIWTSWPSASTCGVHLSVGLGRII
ncbi:MAG: hypothetical protein IPQ21_21900 [Betaproteobacteria bacterium]|nr:hypothetical protein [Betaproteobacteria bacterium]